MLDPKLYRIRPVCVNDKDMLLRWRNQNHVKAYMFSDNDITPEEHRAWMGKMLLDVTSDYQIIEFQDQPIGLANAVDIDLDNKTCHWGLLSWRNHHTKRKW